MSDRFKESLYVPLGAGILIGYPILAGLFGLWVHDNFSTIVRLLYDGISICIALRLVRLVVIDLPEKLLW